MNTIRWAASCAALFSLLTASAHAQRVQTVARFPGAMVTGVTVSHSGRIFVCFPHWGDDVKYTVGEVKGGRTVPYPNAAINKIDKQHPANCLYSVQSVVVDPADRLWALDTGSVKLGPNVPGGPKLVCFNLRTNTITRIYAFPRTVVDADTYLNDVRFDLRHNVAYITDSGAKSANGIIVLNLKTGRSVRRLGGHPSVKPEPGFVPVVEGLPLLERKHGLSPQKVELGSDGIAISPDGKTLYYCPLVSRHLYSVRTDALRDPSQTEADVEGTVKDLGIKGASDGLETDSSGNIYATDYQNHQTKIRRAGNVRGNLYTAFVVSPGSYEWPDTMSVAENGYLYWTANQLQRQARFHNDKDLRVRPYTLYRVRALGPPVELK